MRPSPRPRTDPLLELENHLKRFIAIAIACSTLATPAAASAAGPAKADKRTAQSECRAERGTSDVSRDAFKAKYRNFGACVSRTIRSERVERRAARSSALGSCREERGDTAESRAAFAEKYGTNRNLRNAFGKCVASSAKALERAEDAADLVKLEARAGASAQCDAERGTTAESRTAFAELYGTNRNRRNAFGKCVSRLTQAAEEEAAEATDDVAA